MVSITCQKRATGIPDRDSLKYHLQHFKLARTLIEGAFGKVVLAEHTRENKMYEVKVLKNDLKLSDELIVLGSKSRFLQNIHSYFQLSDLLVLTTEHIPGNNLLFHLSGAGQFCEELARFYSAEIVLGLQYLHCHGIIYKHLSLETVMLTREGHAVLTVAFIMHRSCKLACIAPELPSGCPPSPSADCWNLGIMIYQMVAGKYPFLHDDEQVLSIMIQYMMVVIPSTFSKDFDILI